MHVGYHYFLGIYHLLHFGSSEMYVYVSFKHCVLCIQLYILIHVVISIKAEFIFISDALLFYFYIHFHYCI